MGLGGGMKDNTLASSIILRIFLRKSILKMVILLAVVVLMGNLNALIDAVLHPEIPYFDKEHEIVGGVSAVLTAFLLTLLVMYMAKVRNNEDRLRSLFEASSDFILILDKQGTIIAANQATLRTTGYRENEIIGHAIHEFFTPASRKICIERFPALLRQGANRVELEFVFKNGTVTTMDCSGSAIHDEKGEITSVLLIERDITERKRAEMEQERLILQLQEALAKVKTLSGLLPICASCKKIRDDKGYWTQIERYISKHSNAEFSHGICPDCAKKLYSDYVKEKK
jgi:PAS domain S-box-containing protein